MPMWGEWYFDHFVKFLGDLTARQVFEQNLDSPSIQILSYDNVFAGCRTFATLGLSHYATELGRVGEVVVPVDDCWEEIPAIMANALFFMIQNRIALGRGIAISGAERVVPEFTHVSNKVALYITVPFGLPDEFATVTNGGQEGLVYMGFFISGAEMEYFRQNGAESFEYLLERADIDPFEVKRPSII